MTHLHLLLHIVTLDIEALVPWHQFIYSLLIPDGRLAIQPVRGTQRAQILRYCECLVTIWYTSARDMFTIDRNKSLVNFTGSDVLRLQKPNHASHLTVGGSYQRVHCHNLSHSQRGKVCCTNCNRQLSTLYWTHHMTHQLKSNNCAGCMRKRSLLSRCPTYVGVSFFIGLLLLLRVVWLKLRVYIIMRVISVVFGLTETKNIMNETRSHPSV